jgi:CHRD domain
MGSTKLLAALAALAVGAAVTGANVAAAPSATMKVSATLTAKAEVPVQVVKNTKGSGSFTGTLTGRKLVWKLTFAHLSGPAMAAHIHLGKTGKAGNVVVPLCAGAKCKSGVHGSATLTAAVLKALTTGGTYVNVHTAKNPNGEIRGQISP